MEDRTEDRAFELLKKLVKNVQLSSKKILILITGIVISAFITFIRPQIVSTLTDFGAQFCLYVPFLNMEMDCFKLKYL